MKFKLKKINSKIMMKIKIITNFKVINKNEVVDYKESVEIDAGKKVKANYNSDLEYWYDNYFISYGYQKVKEIDSNKKNVFYFNKIAFQ